MPDDIDLAQEREDIARADAIRKAAKEIPAGEPGDCDLCGEWAGRLVGGACPRCRGKFKLP